MLGSARELNGQIRAPLCPRCKGYLGIVVPEQKAKMPA